MRRRFGPRYFQKVLDGDKTFELRLANFKCKEGDTLLLKEWNPQTRNYTGRQTKKKVFYKIMEK